MKTKHFILLAIIALSVTPGASAQEFHPFTQEEAQGQFNSHKHHMCEQLTDDQKALLDDLNKTHFKSQQVLRLEMNVLKAEQKALLEKESPDVKAIEKKVDEMAKLKAQMAKAKAAHMVELKKVLPEKHFGLMHHGDHQKGKDRNFTANKSHGPKGMRGNRNFGKQDNQHQYGRERVARFRQGDNGGRNGRMERAKGLQKPAMSADDRAAVKQLMEPVIKSIRENKNQRDILKAKQRLLMVADEVDLKSVNKNIDEIAKLEAAIMKEHIKARISLKDKLPLGYGHQFGMKLNRSKDLRGQGRHR